MEKIQPNYYAIVPANVRYSKKIMAAAKLLYGEITALSNEKGYCWAGDSYFQELYGVSKTTIQNWLRSLEDNNFIKRDVIYKDGSKEILYRYISIVAYPTQENLHTPIQENLRDNTTSFNNTVNNTKEVSTVVDSPASTWQAMELYQKVFGFPNTVVQEDMRIITEEIGDDLVTLAIKIAAKNEIRGKGVWNYIEAIIKKWSNSNIKTLEQAEQQQRDFELRKPQKSTYNNHKMNGKKESLPEWANEVHVDKPMSAEDEAYFKKQLENMKNGGKPSD